MHGIGFAPLLPDELPAPIFITFLPPSDPHFYFPSFSLALRALDFLIFPGELTVADTFRIGCIGLLTAEALGGPLTAVNEVFGAFKLGL
jgi:hypothetical protein